MSNIVIEVENLSKKYALGEVGYNTLYHTVQSKIARLLGKEDPNKQIGSQFLHSNEEFWAIKDINFKIKQGERVGIIGRNGAGKSTLLKILSKVTSPTNGSVKIKGRVASLLEVGTGFHPELTGRENIYLNGTILGMTKKDIDKKFDEIVTFAEVEKFIDTPVKRYSSGMYVRLAFAVAAHLDPEILIVDEVLAVGDASFQKKALGKMEDVSKGDGRTILFVSHNMGAIRSLCNKAILLSKGCVQENGSVDNVIDSYLNQDVVSNNYIKFDTELDHDIDLTYITIKNDLNEITNSIDYLKNLIIEIGIIIRKKVIDNYIAVTIYDSSWNTIVFTADDDLNDSALLDSNVGEYYFHLIYPEKLLRPGKYYLRVDLCQKNVGKIDKRELFITFEVFDALSKRSRLNLYRKAMVAPEIKWEIFKGK